MKKRFVIIFPLLALLFVFSACSDDNGEGSGPVVRNISNSGCKEAGVNTESNGASSPDILGRTEKIVCKGAADGTLRITHQDLVVNCASKFNARVWLAGNRIVLTETAEGEEANCVCAYDLTTEIGPLLEKDYSLVVKTPSGEEVSMAFHFSPGLNSAFDVRK
ncbi:hypothetical protein [Prevotella sp. KH2C16]|uniref:hypothetical protein n=1 Tax=Prevotella sp. KH2C16 TaxID=1855325 RepID=UPI0008E2680B|nr:hypothetical protein [Prevotella sp. KH2C16]SFG66436.1 hypothetical protein SAMN05216383_12711 [Prevotella sp. KH2C16]